MAKEKEEVAPLATLQLVYLWSLPVPKVMGQTTDSLPFEMDMIFPPQIQGNPQGAMPGVIQQQNLAANVARWLLPQIQLSTQQVPPSQSSNLGQVVQPTATWYLAATATLGRPWLDGAGNWHVTVSCPQFDYSGVSPACTIYNAALVATY